MKYRKIKIIIISITVLVCISITISNSFVIIKGTNSNDRIGIIDTNLSQKSNMITYSNNTKFNGSEETHGDKLIEFIKKCQKTYDLYYYDATDNDGNIKTQKIIEGLEWMQSNSVKRVNISLSNKVKHKDLETWIDNHNDIKVFVSYNNKYNSFDYPAMYENVIASGCDNRINYKAIDYKYKSNKIIIWPNIIKVYTGNSYLSVLSMLNYK